MSGSGGWMTHAWQRRVTRRGAIAMGGGAAFLAACGGGSKKEEKGEAQATAAPGVQPTQAAATQTEGTPKIGGSFTWPDTGDTPLDPTTNTTYRAQTVAAYVYPRLLKFKTGPTPEVAYNYEVIPDLAEAYEFSGDGLQLTFKLRSNVKMHNKPPVNGRLLTSEDVKASFERFRNTTKNGNRGAFGSDSNKLVLSMETPDARTVVVKLAKQYAPILNMFANPQYFWIQPKEIETGFDPAKDMIGAGPFIFEKQEQDKQITFRRNPEYFVQGKPYIDTVYRVVIPDVAQRIAQYQAGRLDYYDVPAQNKDEVLKTNPKSQVIKSIPTTYYFISPQQRGNTPFKDVRVRRAISMAIDRESWFKLIYLEGQHYTNAVPASMGKWWLNPKGSDTGPGGQWFKFDPKAARDMLKAAGMENLPFRYIFANTAYGDVFNESAEATAQMLKEAGFNPTIVTQDYLRDYIDLSTGTFGGKYEGAFYGLETPFTDPHDYLFNNNHPLSQRNHAGVDDPKLTAMIDDAGITLDEAARVKKVQEIQRYWMDQMFYIPIAVGYSYSFRQPWVKGLNAFNGNYGHATDALMDAWIDKG